MPIHLINLLQVNELAVKIACTKLSLAFIIHLQEVSIAINPLASQLWQTGTMQAGNNRINQTFAKTTITEH
jgi:hypothetical protein